MEPVLLFFNEREFDKRLAIYEPALLALNKTLNAYNELGYRELTDTEFRSLLNSPLETLFDIMTEDKPFQIGGLEVDKTQAMALIKKPSGFVALEYQIAECIALPYCSYVLSISSLVDGEIVYNETAIAKEKKHYEIWATTDSAINANSFVEKVLAAAKECFGDNPMDVGSVISSFIEYGISVYGSPTKGIPDKYANFINYERIQYFGATMA